MDLLKVYRAIQALANTPGPTQKYWQGRAKALQPFEVYEVQFDAPYPPRQVIGEKPIAVFPGRKIADMTAEMASQSASFAGCKEYEVRGIE